MDERLRFVARLLDGEKMWTPTSPTRSTSAWRATIGRPLPFTIFRATVWLLVRWRSRSGA